MNITGAVGVGSYVVNDYVLSLEAAEGGHILSIRKGTDLQTAFIPGGRPSNRGFAPDGRDLKETFGGADGLAAALAAEDYSRIDDLDFYTVRFSGAYRDHSAYILPAGGVYYSDIACAQAAGASSEDIPVDMSLFSPAYYTFTLPGGVYYAKKMDLRPYTVRSIDRDITFEACVNHYFNYGDTPLAVPHVCFTARELISGLRPRAHPLQWADALEEEYTGDGSTRAYAPADSDYRHVRYVCVDGALKSAGTDYTSSGGTVTFASGRAPESGSKVLISRTLHDDPYRGSALYRTLCDGSYGLVNTIRDEGFSSRLANMRIHSAAGWRDSGLLFIPRLGEVFCGAESEPVKPFTSMASSRRAFKTGGYFTATPASDTSFCAVSAGGTVQAVSASGEAGILLCAVFRGGDQ